MLAARGEPHAGGKVTGDEHTTDWRSVLGGTQRPDVRENLGDCSVGGVVGLELDYDE
jgi:hypothetical protein